MTVGETIFRVFEICLPIFTLVGFGAWLRHIGWLTDDARTFLNRFLYHFSLPSLIFFGVATQNFSKLINPAIFVAVLATTVISGAAFFVGAHLCGLRTGLRATVSHSPFWGNVTYLGFPLARNAFGEDGFTYACIVNAVGMPAFVIIGIFLLSMGSEQKVPLARQCKQAFASPVVLAAFGGILASLIGIGGWINTQHATMDALAQQAAGVTTLTAEQVALIGDGDTPIWSLIWPFFDNIGSVGLPLALLAVGGALRIELIRGRIGLMLAGSVGKLAIGPAMGLGILTLGTTLGWWPEPSAAAIGATVLLMACPVAVSAYIVADQLGVEPEINAGMMVLSTLLSIITIPLWVALLI